MTKPPAFNLQLTGGLLQKAKKAFIISNLGRYVEVNMKDRNRFLFLIDIMRTVILAIVFILMCTGTIRQEFAGIRHDTGSGKESFVETGCIEELCNNLLGKTGVSILSLEGIEKESDPDYDEYPESKDDFFSSFFTSANSRNVQIDVEKYDGEIDFRLGFTKNMNELLTLRELYAKCSPSVVTIITYQNKLTEFGMGTGIIISADGLIMTNTHVIDDCDRITVKLSNDNLYEALLVGADASSDIAVLKIDASSLPVAEFGNSDTLQVGEEVAAIGNPLSESFRSTLTNGIISGIDRA